MLPSPAHLLFREVTETSEPRTQRSQQRPTSFRRTGRHHAVARQDGPQALQGHAMPGAQEACAAGQPRAEERLASGASRRSFPLLALF